MLKRRIIPIQLLDLGRLVKTIRFTAPRDVGDPIKSSKVYSDQDADELLLLNITREPRNVDDLVSITEKISRECFVPFSVGGGIQCVDDVGRLFDAGADKVVINTLAFCNTRAVEKIARLYGRQAIIVGIDVREVGESYALFSNCGQTYEDVSLEEHINRVTNVGVGEIMIQSIDEDGVMLGYNMDLLNQVVKLATVPVIAAGGAGNFMHLKEAFDLGVDAVACGSLFNFGDNNPLRAKAYLKNYNVPLKQI